jgi:hypothetical protein
MKPVLPASGFDPLEASMFDLFMLGLGLGLFAVTIGYAYVCERF